MLHFLQVFDYSAEQMTTAKACRLKERFCTEFQQVFELCTRIMVWNGLCESLVEEESLAGNEW